MQSSPRIGVAVSAAIMAFTVSAAQPSLAEDNAWVLEEILVTAQRRVDSVQNAPVSVTAFSADTIEELSILDIEALSKFAPNVTIHKVPAGSANATVRIRGLANTEVIITTDPKVTLYLDGVLIAKAAGSMLDLIDLERIEVLRGPQGTLFGRNAVGGAITVHSREPADEWDFSQTFNAGNYDYLESQTMINAPLMDSELGTLAARGVYMYRERDGWVENEAGDDWGAEDRRAGRFSLAWNRENWGARYIYDFSDWEDTIPAPFLEAVGDFDPLTLTPKNPGLSAIFPIKFDQALDALGRDEEEFADFIQLDRDDEVPSEFIGDHNLDASGHSLTLEANFDDRPWLGDITVRSITAYRETDRDSIGELDGTPVAISFFDTADESMEQFTQEFQFIGNTYDERLDYVVGLYWFDEDGDLDSYNRTLDFTITGDEDPLSEIFTTVGVDNEAWAVYGQATLADIFTERLSLTLGLRYTEETRGMSLDKEEFQAGALQIGGCDPALPDFNPEACLSFVMDEDEDYDNVSWETNLKYQWTDDVMSYLRISTGFQSGGFNGRAASLDAAVVPFGEEESLQYELGVKSRLWQQRINLNLAGFYTETDDLQLPQFPPDSDSPNVGTVVKNAGESHSYGAELEMQALLTPDLETYFNFAWFEGEFDEYIIGFDDVDGDGERETPVDVAGTNKFAQTPQYQAGAGARYAFGDTGFGELWARLDLSWQDDNLFNGGGAVQTVNAPELDREAASARDLNQQDAYTLVDAMVTLERIPLVKDGNLRLSLWGRNLTDEEYRYTSVDLMEFLGLGVTHYGDPRTYGVTLSYSLR